MRWFDTLPPAAGDVLPGLLRPARALGGARSSRSPCCSCGGCASHATCSSPVRSRGCSAASWPSCGVAPRSVNAFELAFDVTDAPRFPTVRVGHRGGDGDRRVAAPHPPHAARRAGARRPARAQRDVPRACVSHRSRSGRSCSGGASPPRSTSRSAPRIAGRPSRRCTPRSTPARRRRHATCTSPPTNPSAARCSSASATTVGCG